MDQVLCVCVVCVEGTLCICRPMVPGVLFMVSGGTAISSWQQVRRVLNGVV